MKKNEKLPSLPKATAAASNQSQRKRRRIPLRPNRTAKCLLPNDIRAVSAELKSIVLDRLEKEIVSKFLSKANKDYGYGGVDDERGNEASKMRKEIGKRRIVVGVNQVTRSLERLLLLEKKKQQQRPQDGKVVANGEGGKVDDESSGHPKVRLIIMCKDSLALLGHIPVLAWSNINIPFIMISGKSASEELGRIMGCKRVSVCLFLDRYEGENKTDSVSGRKYDDEMDSSLNYIKEVCLK